MDRRRFLLTSLAGAFAGRSPPRRSRQGKVSRVGMFRLDVSTGSSSVDAFGQGSVTGLSGGPEYHHGVPGPRRGEPIDLPGLADELVRLEVDVLFARQRPPCAPAAGRATTHSPDRRVNRGRSWWRVGSWGTWRSPGDDVTGLSYAIHPDV